MEIWKEFVDLLKKGAFPADKVKPYSPLTKEPLLQFLDEMRSKANWKEWELSAEMHKVNKKVHFLLPLTFDGQQHTYCFSFLVEKNQWYLQHLEGITIRLDKISSLPTSAFPDITEPQKAWIREEIATSEKIRLFKQLAEEKGKTEAYEWFKDGSGYLITAKAWVPFVNTERAFILYICWEQANLRGNYVTLYKLDNKEALLKMTPIYFKLYKQTGHLRQLINWNDYRQLFEVIWKDRAKHAGWNLEIEYEKDTCVLHFTR